MSKQAAKQSIALIASTRIIEYNSYYKKWDIFTFVVQRGRKRERYTFWV